MSNFWDNIGSKQQNNYNFNIQDFMKFYNENKGKDMNQTINQLLQSGQISKSQLEQATNQAKGVMQMLQNIGFIK